MRGIFLFRILFKQVLNELIKFAKWLSEKWNGEMDDGNGDRTDGIDEMIGGQIDQKVIHAKQEKGTDSQENR